MSAMGFKNFQVYPARPLFLPFNHSIRFVIDGEVAKTLQTSTICRHGLCMTTACHACEILTVIEHPSHPCAPSTQINSPHCCAIQCVCQIYEHEPISRLTIPIPVSCSRIMEVVCDSPERIFKALSTADGGGVELKCSKTCEALVYCLIERMSVVHWEGLPSITCPATVGAGPGHFGGIEVSERSPLVAKQLGNGRFERYAHELCHF